MLDEQVAPVAVDLFIRDMELTGELNPSSEAVARPSADDASEGVGLELARRSISARSRSTVSPGRSSCFGPRDDRSAAVLEDDLREHRRAGPRSSYPEDDLIMPGEFDVA